MKKPEAGSWKLEAGGGWREAGSGWRGAALRLRSLSLAPLRSGILLAALASCSGPTAPVRPSAGENPAPATSLVPGPAATTGPSLAVTAEATPTQEPCRADARFLEDLTIPDGSIIGPGEEVDKRWVVENAGTCDWGPGYVLVRVSNDELSGPAEIDLYPARAGTRAVWQVVFLAPLIPGQYVSEWQAQTPDGTRFGEEVFVDLIVQPRP